MVLIAGPTSISLSGLLEEKIARNQRRQTLKKNILGPMPEIRNSQSRSIRRYHRVWIIEFAHGFPQFFQRPKECSYTNE